MTQQDAATRAAAHQAVQDCCFGASAWAVVRPYPGAVGFAFNSRALCIRRF